MKKGFTLIELMGVIVLLSILSVVTVVGVDKMLKQGKDDLYQSQIHMIELSAQDWLIDNPENKPTIEPLIITFQTLVDAGYLESEINNPKTNEHFELTTQIKITKVSQTFTYEVMD